MAAVQSSEAYRVVSLFGVARVVEGHVSFLFQGPRVLTRFGCCKM